MEFEDKVEDKQVVITTIVKNQLLRDETRISGKIIDAQIGQPIQNAEIFLSTESMNDGYLARAGITIQTYPHFNT